MTQLRPYQQSMIDETRAAMVSGHRSILLVAPTGSGKMGTLTRMAVDAAGKGKRTYLVFHVRELCWQAADWLQKWGARYGVLMAGEKNPDASALIQICMIQTISRRTQNMAVPDLVVIDEGHHSRANSYATLRTVWPNAYMLGFTATPVRLSGEALLGEGGFEIMIQGPSVGQLTEMGFLAPVKLLTQPESIDLSQVKMTGGDYNEEALDRIFSDDLVGKHVGNAVDEYRKYCDNAPALVVGVSVRHAMRLAGLFTDAGYRAVAVHGGMPREDRLKAVLDFEAGGVKILTYCQVFGEGVDLPAATALFFMRPTASLVVWKQNCGRVMRPAPGKTQAFVFDHVGNAKRQFFGVPMGHPAEEICWKEVIYRQQETRLRKSRRSVVPIVFRRCPACLDIHAPRAALCPKCGHDYAAAAEREADQEAIDVQLEEYKKMQVTVARKGARTLEDLIEHGRRMNYKPGWARMVWEARQRKER